MWREKSGYWRKIKAGLWGDDWDSLRETGREAFILTASLSPNSYFSPHNRLCHECAYESCYCFPEIICGSCRLCPLRIPSRKNKIFYATVLFFTPSSAVMCFCILHLSCQFPVIKVKMPTPTPASVFQDIIFIRIWFSFGYNFPFPSKYPQWSVSSPRACSLSWRNGFLGK